MSLVSPDVLTPEDITLLIDVGGLTSERRIIEHQLQSTALSWMCSHPEHKANAEYVTAARRLLEFSEILRNVRNAHGTVGGSRLIGAILDGVGVDFSEVLPELNDQKMRELERFLGKVITARPARKGQPRKDWMDMELSYLYDVFQFLGGKMSLPQRDYDEEQVNQYPLFRFCRRFISIVNARFEEGVWPLGLPTELRRGRPLLHSLAKLSDAQLRDRLLSAKNLVSARSGLVATRIEDSRVHKLPWHDMY